MDNLLDFFLKVGKLKGKARRGWIAHQIRKPETTAEHTFRMALLAWILAKKRGLNLERVLKMSLIHDLCEVYAGDETPYDPLLPKDLKDKKKVEEILKRWPKFSLSEKQDKVLKKYKRESLGLDKLIAKLSPDLQTEIKNLWIDLEKGLSPEGRFVKQVDKAENFLQGIEYWKKYGKIQVKHWRRWSREIFDDPLLLEFVEAIDRRFL